MPASIPNTQYARSGDTQIAYQVAGEGSLDLVLVQGFISNVEMAWEEPLLASFFERLASFSRLIVFDKRGQGLSDPVTGAPTLEQRMDDVGAVMDAAGSERAAIFGLSEGAPLSMLFAASHPDRTSALALFGAVVKGTGDAQYPWAPTRAMWDGYVEALEEAWGEGLSLSIIAPGLALDDDAVRRWGRFERLSSSPGMVVQVLSMVADIDISSVLPTIRVPTLVLHRTGDTAMSVEGARFMAGQIAGVKYVELPGDEHLFYAGDTGALLDEVEEFLTGTLAPREPDRVLATVMFTDIVGSTERAAEMGDGAWRELLARHDQLMRQQIERHRGREVKTMGDGFLAAFDGPARAIRCACAAAEAVRGLGIQIRAGLHTGECELIGDDVGGIAVNIGARVGAAAGPGEVLVSRTVTDLVAGSGLRFASRGAQTLKGVPGQWELFAVQG